MTLFPFKKWCPAFFSFFFCVNFRGWGPLSFDLHGRVSFMCLFGTQDSGHMVGQGRIYKAASGSMSDFSFMLLHH